MCLCIFCSFLKWIAWGFLQLSFETYILDTRSLLDMWFLNMFPQSLACLLIPSKNSFAEQKHFDFIEACLHLNNFQSIIWA